MKFADLKAQVLDLADVQNSQELKRCYPITQAFNLSYKKSWEALLLRFQSNTKPELKVKTTIHTLKSQVLKLAKVKNIQQLKRHYDSLKSLDFRYSSAWETALSELTKLQADQSKFEKWLESPPESYKNLFQEIKTVSQNLENALEKGKRLGHNAKEMADSILELAQEVQDDVKDMKQELKAQAQIRHQSEMN